MAAKRKRVWAKFLSALLIAGMLMSTVGTSAFAMSDIPAATETDSQADIDPAAEDLRGTVTDESEVPTEVPAGSTEDEIPAVGNADETAETLEEENGIMDTVTEEASEKAAEEVSEEAADEAPE